MRRYMILTLLAAATALQPHTLQAQEPLQLGIQLAAGDNAALSLQFHITKNIAIRPGLTLEGLAEKNKPSDFTYNNPVLLDLLYYVPIEERLSMYAGVGFSGGWDSQTRDFTQQVEYRIPADTLYDMHGQDTLIQYSNETRDSSFTLTSGNRRYSGSVFSGVQYAITEHFSFQGEVGLRFNYFETTTNEEINSLSRRYFLPRMRLGMIYYFW